MTGTFLAWGATVEVCGLLRLRLSIPYSWLQVVLLYRGQTQECFISWSFYSGLDCLVYVDILFKSFVKQIQFCKLWSVTSARKVVMCGIDMLVYNDYTFKFVYIHFSRALEMLPAKIFSWLFPVYPACSLLHINKSSWKNVIFVSVLFYFVKYGAWKPHQAFFVEGRWNLN